MLDFLEVLREMINVLLQQFVFELVGFDRRFQNLLLGLVGS